MFDYKNVTIIYLRMFLNILTANITAVNKRLEKLVLNSVPTNAHSMNCLFGADGITVLIVLRENSYYLIISVIGGFSCKEIKLGRTPKITKSILNQLEVWFHKEYRLLYNDSMNIITESIKCVNIKPFINEISWVKRLTFGKNTKEISYGTYSLDKLLQTRVTVQHGISNKLHIFVDIHTGRIKGILAEYIPVHAGIMRSYHARKTTDPINKWLHEVLLEHVDVNLK